MLPAKPESTVLSTVPGAVGAPALFVKTTLVVTVGTTAGVQLAAVDQLPLVCQSDWASAALASDKPAANNASFFAWWSRFFMVMRSGSWVGRGRLSTLVDSYSPTITHSGGN